MADVREFVFQGVGFETLIKVDVSKYSDLPPVEANTKIREEVAKKGIEWFKNQPDDLLEVSVLLGIWEHKPEMKAHQYYGPYGYGHFGGFLLELSDYIKRRSDVWIGRVAPYAINKKSLQSKKDTDKPDQLYP